MCFATSRMPKLPGKLAKEEKPSLRAVDGALG